MSTCQVDVLVAGLATTVQDGGRVGFAEYGVATCGAFDRAAYQLGQCLLPGHDKAAALEITLLGPTLRFSGAAVVALSGAPIEARLDGEPVGCGRAFPVSPGSILKLGHIRQGCRSYLAVAGGWELPLRLGSASTDLRGGFGGLAGRRLAAGDQLTCRPAEARAARGNWTLAPSWVPRRAHPAWLHFLPNPACSPDIIERVCRQVWTVGRDSNRQGLRLQGEAGPGAAVASAPSEPVIPGTIQLPPSGLPIMLGVDAQTVGGYPVAGWVIDADLDRLAQLPPGQSLVLHCVDREHALALAGQRRRGLQRAELAIRARCAD